MIFFFVSKLYVRSILFNLLLETVFDLFLLVVLKDQCFITL